LAQFDSGQGTNCDKITNISIRVLFAGNDRLQDVLAADDPNSLVIASMTSTIERM
jgi:hypothetical protein